jgi:hypothetical protein
MAQLAILYTKLLVLYTIRIRILINHVYHGRHKDLRLRVYTLSKTSCARKSG